jgi:subtilisin-like proprotein convertase family protein
MCEGLEQRQLMAADVTSVSPGTFTDLVGQDTAITNTTDPTVVVTTSSKTNTLIYDVNNNNVFDLGVDYSNSGSTVYSFKLSQFGPPLAAPITFNVFEFPGVPVGGEAIPAEDSVSITVDLVAPVAPSVPDLQQASDSGSSDTDNYTNDSTPTFTVTLAGYTIADIGTKIELMDGATPVASVTLGGGEIGAGFVNLTASSLADGVRSFTARATDPASNVTSSLPLTPVTIDTLGPTPVLASAATNPTNVSPIPFTVNFGEDVSGFLNTEVTAGNGTVGALSGGPANYTSSVTPTANGAVTLDIAAGVAVDLAGNLSKAATQISRTFDNIGPTVTAIAITSASGVQNNRLNAGDVVTVTVTMNEITNVTGTPQLALKIGSATQQANYASGTGSTSLTFTYTIAAPDTDANGISIDANSLSLNGGTLTDGLGNNATLTHAAVADNSSYLVDTTAPTVAITRQTPTAAITNATNVTFGLTFSEDVQNVGPAVGDFTKAGAALGNLAAPTGAGSVYSLNVSTVSGTGDQLGLDVLAGTDVTDLAGNALTVTPTTDQEYTIDTVAPTSAIATPVNGAKHNAVNWPGNIAGTAGGTGTAVDSVRVTIKNNAENLYWNGTAFTAAPAFVNATVTPTGPTSASYNLPFAAGNFPVNDIYKIEVRAVDVAGNVESTSFATITFDTANPTATVVTPVTTFDHTPTLSGTFADLVTAPNLVASGVASVTVALAGPTAVPATPATMTPVGPAANGTWSFTAPALLDGSYVVTVVATDASGNTFTTVGALTVFTLAVRVEATDTDGREDSPNPPTQTNGQWTVSLVAFNGVTPIPVPAGTFPLANDLTVNYTMSNVNPASPATYGNLASGGDFTVDLGTPGATINVPAASPSSNLPFSNSFTLLKSGVPTLINMNVSDDLVLDPGEAVLLTVTGTSSGDVTLSSQAADDIDIIDNEAVLNGITVSVTAIDPDSAETTVPFNISSILTDDIVYNQNALTTNVPDPTQTGFTAGGNIFLTNATNGNNNDGLPNNGFFPAVIGNNPAIQLNLNDNDNGPNAKVFAGSPSSVVLPHVPGKYEYVDVIGSAIGVSPNNVKLSLTVEYGVNSFTTPFIAFPHWNDDAPLPAGTYILGNPDMDSVNFATPGVVSVADDPALHGVKFDLKTGNAFFGNNTTKITLNVDNGSPANNRFALFGAFGTQSVGNQGEYEIKLTSGGNPVTTGADVTTKLVITGSATHLADYNFDANANVSGVVLGSIDVKIPAGSSSTKFKFTTVDDFIIEPTEDIVLTVDTVTSTPAVQPFLTKNVTPATATILDNDFGLLTISATDNSAAEPGGPANDGQVTVTMNPNFTTYPGPVVSSTDTYVPVAQTGTATTNTQTVGATTTNPDYQTGIDEVEPNTSGAPQRIDGYWNTNANPNIGNASTIPHNTVFGTGDGTTDYYSFMITAGQTATFDLDQVTGFDSYLQIFDVDGVTELASNDDIATLDPGSTSTTDSLVSFTAVNSGLHTVRVSRVPLVIGVTPPRVIPAGSTYQLHASIGGHAVGALIPAGQSSTNWRVQVINDNPQLIEPTETAVFTLGAPVIGDPQITSDLSAATVNIADDELNNTLVIQPTVGKSNGMENPQTNPEFTISILNAALVPTASDSVTSAKFKVNGLPLGAEFGATKDYTFQLGGAGSITYDALLNEGTVTIPAGTASVTLTVIVNNDNIIEDDEDIQVELISPKVSGDTDITVNTAPATVSIISDDDSGAVTLNGGVPAIEGIQNGVFVVGLSGGKTSDTDTLVKIKLTNAPIVPNTASAVDYSLVQVTPGTLLSLGGDEYQVTIKAGTTSTTLNYVAPTDGLLEPDEKFNAEIVPFSGLVDVGGDDDISISTTKTAVGTIVDNDVAYLKISKDNDVAEGATENFTVQLFKDAALTIPYADAEVLTPITYTVTDGGGTATPGAALPADYLTVTPTNRTIPSGKASQKIAIATFNDTIADAGETVKLTISNPGIGGSGSSGRIQISTSASDVMTIIDNDAVIATVTTNPMLGGDATMQERNNNGKVVVELSGPVATHVTVELSIAHSSTAGSGDFTISTTFVTLAPFETSKVVDLTVLDDVNLEGAEFVDVSIHNIFAIDPQVSVPAPTFTFPVGVTPVGTPIRWNALDGGNDHWYVQVSTTQNFQAHLNSAAASTFESNGLALAKAHLATLTSAAEENFVFLNLFTGNAGFLGAINNPGTLSPALTLTGTAGPGKFGGGAGGQHKWITNENWTYGVTAGSFPWQFGQPDNAGGVQNVVAYDGAGLWDDVSGASTLGAFYEFESPNTPTNTSSKLPLGSSVRVTILPDPQIQVVTTDATGTETVGALPVDKGVFRVQLRQDEVGFTNTVANNVTVSYILRGEATQSSDYSAHAPALIHTVVIPAGQSGADIDISVIDDPVIENNEKVWIQVVGVAATGNDVDLTLESNLYSLSSTGQLRLINQSNGATIGSPITISGVGAVASGQGLAVNPVTGDMYALVKTATNNRLIQITSITPLGATAVGVGTSVDTGRSDLNDIAFGNDGTLYAVSETGDVRYTLSLATGAVIAGSNVSMPAKTGSGEAIALGDPASNGPLYRIAGTATETFATYNPATNTETAVGAFGGGTQGKVTALTWNYAGTKLFFADFDIANVSGGADTEFFELTTTGTVTAKGNMDHNAEGLAYFHQSVTIVDNDLGILKIVANDDTGHDGYPPVLTDDAQFTVSLINPLTGLPITSDTDTNVTFNVMGTATPYLGDQTEGTNPTSLATPMNLDTFAVGPQGGAYNWSLLSNSKIVNSTQIPHTSVTGTGPSAGTDFDWYSFTVLNNGDRVIIDIDGTDGWNSFVEITDLAGNPLPTPISNNDGGGDAADGASTDSFIDTTALDAGTYLIKVGAGPTGSGGIPSNSPVRKYTLNLSVQNHLISDYQLTSNVSSNLTFDTGTGNWTATIPTGSSSIPLNVNVFNDTQVEQSESVLVNMIGNAGDADIHLGGAATSIDPFGTGLRIISTGSGATLSTTPITLTPPSASFGQALAKHPTTGVLYATISLPSLNSDGLYTVDPVTGAATLIGNLGDRFDAIAFDNAGQLFGITDISGSIPNAMFKINHVNASKTLFNGALAPFAFVRHALATNPANGLLYHMWGGDTPNANLFLQTINPTSGVITTIPFTLGSANLSGADPTSLGFDSNGVFKLIDSNGGLYTVTLTGAEATITPVVPGAPDSEGMVILQPSMISATATIIDHDVAEVYVVRTDNGAEPNPINNGSITFGLRDPATLIPVTSSTPVNVTYTVGGTATNGADYGLLSPLNVTINAGTSEKTIDLIINNDSIAEGPEQADFTITKSSALPNVIPISSKFTGTVFIAEGDSAVVQVNSTLDSVAAELGNDPAIFTFTLSGAGASAPVTVNFAVDTTTAAPRASAVPTLVNTLADYALSSPTPGASLTFNPATGKGSVTFLAGFTSVNVIVTPNDDSVTEGFETLGLVIESVTPSVPLPITVGSANAAEVVIIDNDSTVVTISKVNDAGEDPSGTPPGDGVTGKFEVKLSNPAENTIAVETMFNVGGSTADIGLPGFGPGVPTGTDDFWSPQITDFLNTKGTITFNPGVTSQIISIIPLEQPLFPEGNENVRFDLTSLITGTGAISFGTSTASLLILDEYFDVTLEVDDSFASENGSFPTDAGSFNVRISSPTSVPTVVSYVIETTGLTNPLARVGQPTINEVEPNQSGAFPSYSVSQNLDINGAGQLFGWSLLSDPEVQASGVTGRPYIRVNATGDGSFDYYTFTAAVGSRVVIDVDRTSIGANTHVFLLNAAGNVIASNDDASAVDPGSASTADSFIDHVITALDGAGPYIVAVGETGSFALAGVGIAGNPLDAGDTYTLNVSVDGHLTADYATPTGLAAPTFTTGQVTIPAGATFVPVNINPVDDKLIEGDETFKVKLTGIVSGNGVTSLGSTGPIVGEITVEDDDIAVVGGSGPASPAIEPASPPTPQDITLSLPFASTVPVVVRFTVTGTATNPVDSLTTSDYTLSAAVANNLVVDGSTTGSGNLNDFLITIPAGQTSAKITITPTDDNVLELQETVIITPTAIVSGDQGGLITASNLPITALIDDTDAGKVINTTLGADLSGSEPGGALPSDIAFLVKLDPGATSTLGLTSDGDITVNWSITSGSAIAAPAAGADYQVVAVPGEVTVNANGTSGTVTIKAGTTSTFIPVLVLNDSVVEGIENLTLTIAAPVAAGGRNATLGTPVAQTATIDDGSGLGLDTGVVKISAFTADAKEAGPVNGVFRISQVDTLGNLITSSSPTKIRVNLSDVILANLGNGVASASDPDGSGPFGVDFTVTTGANVVKISDTVYEVTIPVGSSSTDLVIVPANDSIVESLFETVTATLSTIQPGTDPDITLAIAPDNSAVVKIEDNDVARFSFSNLAPSSSENSTTSPFTGNGKITLTPTLNNRVDVDVTVVVSLGGGTAVGAAAAGGTLANPNDYDNKTLTFTFSKGSLTPTVTSQDVTLFNDTTTEASETFEATLTVDGASLIALAGRPVDLSANKATATITDNDASKFTVSKETVTEGGSLAFTVTLDNEVDTDLELTFALNDGTGPSGAFGTDLDAKPLPFGADFDNDPWLTTKVKFLAGTKTAVGSLPLVNTNDDLLVEGGSVDSFGSETFTAVPVLASNMGRNISLVNGTGTITDNDSSVISISSPDSLASEPGRTDGNASFTVSMSAPSSTATVISFSMSGDAKTGTQNPGAYSPGDYNLVLDASSIAAGATLTFNPTTGTGTVTIPASGTTLTGTPVTAATILLVPIDDDTPPGSPFEGNGLVEDDETAIMTLTSKTGDPNVSILTATNVVGGGAGTPIPDVTVTKVTTNVSGLSSITDLNVLLNLNHSFDNDLEVSLTSPLGTTVILSDNRGGSGNNFTNTVFDDEASTPIATGVAPFTGSFIPDQLLSAFDGQNPNGVWTLTIDDQVGSDSGVLNSWALSFEKIQTASAKIIDDDDATVTIAATQPIATEGGTSAVVTLTLSNPVDEDMVVTVGRDVGGTSSAADYAPLTFPTTVTIPAGSKTATFTVTAVDDVAVEGDETLPLIIDSVSNNADVAIGATKTAEVILRDNGDGLFVRVDSSKSKSGTEPGLANQDAEFTIQVVDGNGNPVAVPIGSTTAGGITVNLIYGGSALQTVDYNAPTLLFIPEGTSSLPITIDIENDFIPENLEDVTITIQSIAAPGLDKSTSTIAKHPTQNTSTVTITDDDAKAGKVESITINNGQAQRSKVKTMTIVVDQVVNLAPGAVVVRQREDSAAPAVYNGVVGGVVATPNYLAIPGKTVINVTFTPSSTFVDAFGSLVDGNYEVELVASLITTQIGALPLDGNGDGTGAIGDNYKYGNNAVDKFYRLTGDDSGAGVTGASAVDIVDLFAFNVTYNKNSLQSGFDADFDFDENGIIDIVDLFAFNAAYNKIRNLGGF